MATRVNLVTGDAVVARQLATYARRIDQLDITSTERPLAEVDTDAYVVPVAQMGFLLDGLERPPTWLPVVAYGRATGLRAAFLSGCRDYLKEPWTADELALRIARIAVSSSFITAWGTIRLSVGSAASERGEVELSIHEYRILRVLLMQLGRPVAREVLFYALWGRTDRSSRAVDVHVSSLRRKLACIAVGETAGELIRSARGVGYFIPACAS